MSISDFLAGIANYRSLSRKSIILLFAHYLRKYKGTIDFRPADLKKCFSDSSLRVPTDLSILLKTLSRGARSPLLKKGATYSLSADGIDEVDSYLASKPRDEESIRSFLQLALPSLTLTASKIKDDNKRRFLAEAIACIGADARRATILMSWLVTMDHMYDYVLKSHLSNFNAALKKRTDKLSKLAIKNKDDFSELKESIFIEVCRSADVISNDVRKILDEKLGIRNSYCHPSGIEIHDSKVVNFIEDLVDNVIIKHDV